jgi:hypothetical protein
MYLESSPTCAFMPRYIYMKVSLHGQDYLQSLITDERTQYPSTLISWSLKCWTLNSKLLIKHTQGKKSQLILGFLLFQMNLQIALSNSLKNWVGIFYGDHIESVDCFWQDIHFYYIDPANPWAWEIFLPSEIFFNFFLQRLEVIIQIFHFLSYSQAKVFYITCDYWEQPRAEDIVRGRVFV